MRVHFGAAIQLNAGKDNQRLAQAWVSNYNQGRLFNKAALVEEHYPPNNQSRVARYMIVTNGSEHKSLLAAKPADVYNQYNIIA